MEPLLQLEDNDGYNNETVLTLKRNKYSGKFNKDIISER